MCSELMLAVSSALGRLACGIHFWTDFQVVLRWIINPDLYFPRFVKRCVDKILLVIPGESWNYVNTYSNPANLGTRENSIKKSSNLHFLVKRTEIFFAIWRKL